MSTVLIVNPRSADGTTGRDWERRLRPAILEAFPGAEARFTEGRGDATRQTRAALEEGADLVVAVGGDGTNNEVVNGFFDPDGTPVRPEAAFSFIPRGTGCDFARWLGVPNRDVAKAARMMAGAGTWPIDIGHLVATGLDGEPVPRCFLNIIDFGIGGMVSQRVNRGSKRFGGFVSFLWHTLVSLLHYENQPMEVRFDDGEVRRDRFRSVIVANGRFFGGGMNIAPGARLDDGRFEILILPDVGLWDSLKHTPKLYGARGLLDVNNVESCRAVRVHAAPGQGADTVWVEMDGESPGVLPLEVRLLPGALRLRAPRPPDPAV